MGREDLDDAIRAIMAARREELGGPPTPDELLAWRDGRLDPVARQSVEARLAVHPDAARALADLAAFPDVEPMPGTPELSDEDVEARWMALREKLGEMEEGGRTVVDADLGEREGGGTLSREAGEGRGGGFRPLKEAPSPALPRAAARERELALPARASALKLAAAVFVALGIGFLAGRASRPDLPEGAVNVAIAELTPREEGGVRAVSEVEVPEDSEGLVLVLGAPVGKDFPDYEAEIMDADGARIWSRTGLLPSPLGTFQLAFPRNFLPPGTYRIHLSGRENDRRTPLATYDLRLGDG